MYNFDKAIELALRTWYPKSHELHFRSHHPLGKLLGEWGELLDDYMKSIYKLGYTFNPGDELGDIWYYLRILAYQTGGIRFSFVKADKIIFPEINWELIFVTEDIYTIITGMMYCVNRQCFFEHSDLQWRKSVTNMFFNIQYSGLFEVAQRYNLTIDDLTESNWNKLKPGSNKGEEWMKARLSTDYIGGKVTIEND